MFQPQDEGSPRSKADKPAREANLRPVCVYACSHFNHIPLFVTSWTVARQAPLCMGFSRQEYWSGLPCPPPGDLPDPGIEPPSLTSPVPAGGFFTTSATREALNTLFSLYCMFSECFLSAGWKDVTRLKTNTCQMPH